MKRPEFFSPLWPKPSFKEVLLRTTAPVALGAAACVAAIGFGAHPLDVYAVSALPVTAIFMSELFNKASDKVAYAAASLATGFGFAALGIYAATMSHENGPATTSIFKFAGPIMSTAFTAGSLWVALYRKKTAEGQDMRKTLLGFFAAAVIGAGSAYAATNHHFSNFSTPSKIRFFDLPPDNVGSSPAPAYRMG